MKKNVFKRQATWVGLLTAGMVVIALSCFHGTGRAESYLPYLKYAEGSDIKQVVENLNLDFETVSDTDKLPDNWFRWGHPTYSLSADQDVKYSGKYSVRIEPKADAKPNEFGCVALAIPATFKGSSITVKARIKVEGNKKPIGLMLRIDAGPGPESLEFDNMMHRGIMGTDQWQEYSVTVPLPKMAQVIYIGAILSGKGTLWVDDFQVLIDGKDIALANIKKMPGYDEKEVAKYVEKRTGERLRERLSQLTVPDAETLGFEKVSAQPDWIKWGHKSYKLTRDTADPHSGSYSMRIEPGEGAKPNEFGCVAFAIPAVFKGKEITVKAHIRTQGNDEPIGLLLRVDGKGKSLAFDNMMQNGIMGTDQWQEYSVSLPLPAAGEMIYVGAINSGKGVLWVDDFQVLIDGKELSRAKRK